MSTERIRSLPEPSAAVKREAAVWIARIHSPRRTQALDEGLRQWLKECSEHQRAFEQANELWETASRIPDTAVPRMMRWKRVAADKVMAWPARMAVGLAATLVIAAGTFYYLRDPAVTTEVGEQRTVTLKDGTRVSLNTATRLVVRYDDKERRILMEGGEALFEVARHSRWPFVVIAGDRRITALGTTFVVRQNRSETAITLVDGKVAVSGAGRADTPSILTPGERLTFAVAAPPERDKPMLDKVTAWQRGLVELDETRLADAAAEMNRYSAVQLVIDTPDAAAAPISGVFRAGDSLFFAQAVARTYDLKVAEDSGRIVISGVPRAGGSGRR